MLKIQLQNQVKQITKVSGLILMMGLFASCAKPGTYQAGGSDSSVNSGQSTPGNIPASQGGAVFSPSYKPEPLAWESASHPERAAWSTGAFQIVAEHFADLDKAQDIQTFCPSYRSLTTDEKINLWADMFAGTAYYESSWNPASASVDVGTSSNKDTWSVGLLQMSVVDQANYGLPLGYKYADLQDPIKNLELGITIMALQVRKHGIVLIPSGGSGLYWATLHPGGKYDATSSIVKMTERLSFCK